jgi:hypothetical protein
MPKYRKKPVEIEAIFYPGRFEETEGNIAVEDWLEPRLAARGAKLRYEGTTLILPALNGGQIAVYPGEWIIDGDFELRPCTALVFGQLYDPVVTLEPAD